MWPHNGILVSDHPQLSSLVDWDLIATSDGGCALVFTDARDGSDLEARWNMLMAGLEGGMSIYMGLGPIHALGHMFADSPIHHGALITASAPPVLRFYRSHADDGLGEKLDRLTAAMGLAAGVDIANGIADMNARLGLSPSVRELGYPDRDLDAMADYAAKVHFNATAPLRPTSADYRDIIAEVLG